MKEIVVYESDSGKTFTTKEEAQTEDLIHSIDKALDDIWFPNIQPREVAEFIAKYYKLVPELIPECNHSWNFSHCTSHEDIEICIHCGKTRKA